MPGVPRCCGRGIRRCGLRPMLLAMHVSITSALPMSVSAPRSTHCQFTICESETHIAISKSMPGHSAVARLQGQAPRVGGAQHGGVRCVHHAHREVRRDSVRLQRSQQRPLMHLFVINHAASCQFTHPMSSQLLCACNVCMRQCLSNMCLANVNVQISNTCQSLLSSLANVSVRIFNTCQCLLSNPNLSKFVQRPHSLCAGYRADHHHEEPKLS